MVARHFQFGTFDAAPSRGVHAITYTRVRKTGATSEYQLCRVSMYEKDISSNFLPEDIACVNKIFLMKSPINTVTSGLVLLMRLQCHPQQPLTSTTNPFLAIRSRNRSTSLSITGIE